MVAQVPLIRNRQIEAVKQYAYVMSLAPKLTGLSYLLYLEEDVTTAVADTARLGVTLGAVCADVVESVNAILKRTYDDHTTRPPGGGGGGDAVSNIVRAGCKGGVVSLGLVVFEI